MFVFLRVTIVILAFDVISSPVAAQEKLRFYLSASNKTLGYSPLWVAAKKGFFEQQGLDVQLLLLCGTPMTVQALAGASLNVGSGSPPAFIEASERGLDLVIIVGRDQRPDTLYRLR
jgi:NitT/TauT family transport system substrate-binding protein